MDLKKITVAFAALVLVLPLFAQEDKREVRSGNRALRRGNYNEAEIDYRKALVKDSTSFAASYNLASSLYLQKDYDNAAKALDRVADQLPGSEHASSWYFNKGNIALQQQDYKSAVDAFKQALLLEPGDLQAKESYIYAKKKLEDQQNQDNQQGDGEQDPNQDGEQDPNSDQQQDQQPQDQPQEDRQDQPQEAPAEQQISPQQAQQMLKAIQAKEKETQEKVEKAKALQAQSRRKENNW